MNQELIAFWVTEIFPYQSWGVVESFLANGDVKIVNEDDRTYSPYKVLPHKEGLELSNALHKITLAFTKEQQALVDKYNKKLENI